MGLLQALFFLSGLTGLIYEVVWTRQFSNVLGSTALSMMAVFSTFLLALALGAWVAGRLAWSGRPALALYGWMEIGVGVSALLVTLLLRAGHALASLSPSGAEHLLTWSAFKFLIIFVILAVPVMLMGGTLPVMLGAVREWALPRNAVARLYGWNTLGAACGTLAAGFVLLWKLGIPGTVAVAAAINVLIGASAIVAARRLRPAETPAEALPTADEASEGGRSHSDALWLGLAFLSGFAVLAYEMLWGRLARFLLGDRTLAVSLLLFVFLTALGAGSLAAPGAGRAAARRSSRGVLLLLGWLFLAGALLNLLFALLARETISGRGLYAWLPPGDPLVRRAAAAVCLLFPPISVLGLTFPLLAWSAREFNDRPGRVMGRLYFTNTAGAAFGACLAGIALARWLGTLRGFLAVSALLAAAASVLLARGSSRTEHRAAALAGLAAFLVLALSFPLSMPEARQDETVLASQEDEYGLQVLVRTGQNTLRVRNNRLHLVYDLGHPDTSYAQQMPAHLTVLLAEECRNVLNIGTGYGITAGTFTLYSDVQAIETVEILPFLVGHQPAFAPYNFWYWQDARVTRVIGDGRHRLASSRQAYDIISVNVLDPYLPGSSSLYTVDFWKEASSRLRPGGVYTQLFWGADLPLLVKGMKGVFPTLLYFPAYGGTSYNVVALPRAAGAAEPSIHLERMGDKASLELARLDSRRPDTFIRMEVVEAMARARKIEADAARLTGRLHTDDFPVLEYRWAHGVPGVSILDSPLVEQ
ncbi:MAG: fused MFS/spermidine synthase [Planctomycetes bacterium]|nr:fused MFS/spermidine synthase [Planctomycetota bacterium]